jgi:hypothetical protein
MKQIERNILLKRRAFTRKGVTLFRKALLSQYEDVLEMIDITPFEQIEQRINVKDEPIEKAFEAYYPLASDFALLWRKQLLSGKSGEDDAYRSIFERSMLNYAKRNAGQKIKNINDTTKRYLKESVRDALKEGFDEGLGTDEIRRRIVKNVVNNLKTIGFNRSKMIAQTEMVTASNIASMEGANSTGLEYRKFWSTSGLPNVRESHLAAEQESISKNGLREDETFDSCPGMAYPGDPNGEADDVVNCRCSVLIEIV